MLSNLIEIRLLLSGPHAVNSSRTRTDPTGPMALWTLPSLHQAQQQISIITHSALLRCSIQVGSSLTRPTSQIDSTIVPLINIVESRSKVMDEKQKAARMESWHRHNNKQEQKYAQHAVERSTIDVLTYDDAELLVFIDESGDIIQSKTCSRFCMGGIAVWGRDYKKIERDWYNLKMELLGKKSDELFHATENLKQLDGTGRWKLEKFLAEANFNVVLGQAILDNMFGPEFEPFMASTSPLGVIESHLDQICYHQKRSKHWLIEKSGKQDWRMIKMGMSGEFYHRFPKGEHSRLSFVNKRKTVLCGLEIADLVINLFYRLNPDFSGTIHQWRHLGKGSPPYHLRLYQAAIGIPFAPLFSPHRRAAYGLAF